MTKNGFVVCSVIVACLITSISGCAVFFLANYPESYDASTFSEFHYRAETPPCVDEPADGYIFPISCEARIVRGNENEFSLEMMVLQDEESPPELEQRALTPSEIEQFIEISSELRINRNPRPYCVIPVAGLDMSGDYFLTWDNLELVLSDCDRSRLDPDQVFEILRFLDGLESQRRSIKNASQP